jgi:hypothetical protein
MRAAEDVTKLQKLDRSIADNVALLLIGFDQESDPILETDVAIIRQKTRASGWHEQTSRWEDSFRPKGAIKVWLWTSSVTTGSETPQRSFPPV